MPVPLTILILIISAPTLGLLTQENQISALDTNRKSSRRIQALPDSVSPAPRPPKPRPLTANSFTTSAPKTSPPKNDSATSLLDLSALKGDDESAPPAPIDDSSDNIAGSKKETSQLSLDDLDSKSAKSGSGGLSGEDDDLELGESDAPDSLGWKDNLRFTVDISTRPTYFGPTGDLGNVAFIGIDLHKVITSENGDIGTLTLQPYLARIDNAPAEPRSNFDDPHDWALQWRIFNFNYTEHGKGKTNFRIGHFELPFGLEQIVNTNGTLRDFTHFENFGIKNDWGVSFNGENKEVEYELGLTRGSGNFYRRRDDPYVVSGRIGSSRDNRVVLGLSGLHGEILNFDPSGGTVRQSRLGLDMTIADEKFVYLSEFSAGVVDDDPVFTGLFEIDTYNRDETLLAYNQFVVRGIEQANDWDFEVRDSIGLRWHPDSHWTLSAQVSHFFDVMGTARRGTAFELQARYRF